MNKIAIYVIFLSLFFQRIFGLGQSANSVYGDNLTDTSGNTVFSRLAIADWPRQLAKLKQRWSATVTNKADVQMITGASRQTVNPGDRVTYKITLTNRGKAEAKNITINNLLAPQVELQSASYGARVSASGVVWEMAQLRPGESQVLKISVRVRERIKQPQNIFNLSFIQSKNGESSTESNSSLIVNPLEIPATISI